MTHAEARGLIATYRRACQRARIDPAEGPRTLYEAANAIAEAAKAAARTQRRWQWWRVEWGEPGMCFSSIEYTALINVDHDAKWLRINRLAYSESPYAETPLKALLSSRGQPEPLFQLRLPMPEMEAV